MQPTQRRRAPLRFPPPRPPFPAGGRCPRLPERRARARAPPCFGWGRCAHSSKNGGDSRSVLQLWETGQRIWCARQHRGSERQMLGSLACLSSFPARYLRRNLGEKGTGREFCGRPAGALEGRLFEAQLPVPSTDSGLGRGAVAGVFFPLLAVVSFSYQRPLDTLAFRAGGAGCAPTWLRTRVRTCVSTVWAFSFVQLLPCAPAPSANCQARQCALLERLWHSAIAESIGSATIQW